MENAPGSTSDSVGAHASERDALLHRILAAVEKSRDRGWLELLVAVVLSLATLSSTWCAYQSRQWGGRQNAKQSGADTAERKAAESLIVAFQRRTQDGLVVLEFWRAMRLGETQAAQTIQAHMHPALRDAVQASVDAGILTNPEAPGPLQRPEYRLEQEIEAAAMRSEAARLKADATTAGRWAGDYVILTLMFASVLFFGGIGGTFAHRRIRVSLATISALLFVATVVMLLRLPILRADG